MHLALTLPQLTAKAVTLRKSRHKRRTVGYKMPGDLCASQLLQGQHRFSSRRRDGSIHQQLQRKHKEENRTLQYSFCQQALHAALPHAGVVSLLPYSLDSSTPSRSHATFKSWTGGKYEVAWQENTHEDEKKMGHILWSNTPFDCLCLHPQQQEHPLRESSTSYPLLFTDTQM